jgi:predicted metal-dependent HD superfamily phosphohydrolase
MEFNFEKDLSVIDRVTQKEHEIGPNEKRLELLKHIESQAEKLYGNIPYHNFDHAKDAVDAGYEIVARCQASGIEVNSDLIRYALLFHDSGYHLDHKEAGFDSKEEYSAFLAGDALRSLGVSEDMIESVKRCIISTHKNREFNFLEEKIVRAADLTGLACEYEKFKENAIKLKEETELISGKKTSWEEWKKSVVEIITFYLNQDIRLTECYKDKDGGSRFHRKTKENLDKFMKEE